MPEEPTQAAPEQPQTPPNADGGTGDQPALPELDRATVLALLDKHGDDPEFRKELQSRRFVGGIAGEIAKRTLQEQRENAAREAVEAEQKRLRQLADDDPIAFAEELKVKIDTEANRRELAGLRDTTRREVLKQVSDAVSEHAEFKELTEADVKALRDSMAGIPDEQVVGVFITKATGLVAEKRARKLADADIAERLKAEEKVWEARQAEKRVKAQARPSLRQPTSGNAQDAGEPADFYSKEWSDWYERERKAGRLVPARAS